MGLAFLISQGTWGHHTIGIIANWVLFWIQKHWQGSAFCSITIHYWAYLPLSASSIWAEANFSSLWVPWRSPNCWVRASAWKHETDQRWTPDNFNFLSKCMYVVPLIDYKSWRARGSGISNHLWQNNLTECSCYFPGCTHKGFFFFYILLCFSVLHLKKKKKEKENYSSIK